MSGPQCLFDKVHGFARLHAKQSALVTGCRQITYAELDERSRQVCSGLLSLTPGSQSRIAILTANRPEFFEIWYGATLAGHVLTPINTRLAESEIVFILQDSQAHILFVDGDIQPDTLKFVSENTDIKQIFAIDGHPDWPSYHEWRDTQPVAELSSARDADATVVQMYTSGTTGFPKGVELSHGNFLTGVRSMMGALAWPAGETALVTAPLFHTAGSAYAHCALQSGGTVVLLDELSPATVLTAINDRRVSQAMLVPSLIRMLLESPGCADTDFSSLQRILYGASSIPVSILRQAIQAFGCQFEQGYGLTESVGPVAMLRPEDHDGSEKMRSCGKAVPGSEIRVVNAQGHDCSKGEVGEIIVSGLQVMKAYWNRPEDTAESIRNNWLYTGDAGYFDSDGYLYIHDRLKDMIVSGGENIYPAEVEGVLAACNGVHDVAVIGVPDELWGEAVKALVVLHPGSSTSSEDINAYAHRHIAGFKCPKSIDFVEAIPRNPAGKILKKILREPFWTGFDRRVS
jgi:acyl-CoA synthetase (AMP-forming)/AMP-acid ligase II